MANPTVKEVVSAWLKEHGYDGLYDYECGCTLDDLMPCGGESWAMNCEAGYTHPSHMQNYDHLICAHKEPCAECRQCVGWEG